MDAAFEDVLGAVSGGRLDRLADDGAEEDEEWRRMKVEMAAWKMNSGV